MAFQKCNPPTQLKILRCTNYAKRITSSVPALVIKGTIVVVHILVRDLGTSVRQCNGTRVGVCR